MCDDGISALHATESRKRSSIILWMGHRVLSDRDHKEVESKYPACHPGNYALP